MKGSELKILGCKEGHDGTFAVLNGRTLEVYIESEKDSFPRCGAITNDLLLRAAAYFSEGPDVIAVGGWTKGLFSSDLPSFSGYFGIGQGHEQIREIDFFGKKTTLFSSTHEASHIWNAYSMSPYEQGQPCYILVWEGNVGNFYYIDENLVITDLGSPMTDPGNRYTFLFSLADKNSPDEVGYYDTSHPGKMMALAAFGVADEMTQDELALWQAIRDVPQFELMNKLRKSDFSSHFLFNVGVESAEFKTFARKATDEIFAVFHNFAEQVCNVPSLPLLIAGGCGLNCEWNARWLESDLFSDVFVPPCCNDSGSAAGTAAHALYRLTGDAKLEWNVYAGEKFIYDVELSDCKYEKHHFGYQELAKRLESGSLIAWVEGKYEIGPRALGHRSLLASAHRDDSLPTLNQIKGREAYRPIAAISTEHALQLFDPPRESPFMLFFHQVKSENLPAVTHVDGSTRLQTLSQRAAPHLYKLLTATKNEVGNPVLCNTSLNYPGKGFINRASDLLSYASLRNLDGFVVDGEIYWKPT